MVIKTNKIKIYLSMQKDIGCYVKKFMKYLDKNQLV